MASDSGGLFGGLFGPEETGPTQEPLNLSPFRTTDMLFEGTQFEEQAQSQGLFLEEVTTGRDVSPVEPRGFGEQVGGIVGGTTSAVGGAVGQAGSTALLGLIRGLASSAGGLILLLGLVSVVILSLIDLEL
jgi:hypothetical protein